MGSYDIAHGFCVFSYLRFSKYINVWGWILYGKDFVQITSHEKIPEYSITSSNMHFSCSSDMHRWIREFCKRDKTNYTQSKVVLYFTRYYVYLLHLFYHLIRTKELIFKIVPLELMALNSIFVKLSFYVISQRRRHAKKLHTKVFN